MMAGKMAGTNVWGQTVFSLISEPPSLALANLYGVAI